MQIFPARSDSPSLKDQECIFFTAVHLRQLVELLKRGGAQLKGPFKTIDMATSMIRLVPEKLHSALSDMLFQRAIEIVCICIAESQETPEICKSLDRLLLACSNCACFSINQRIKILDSARETLTAVTRMKQATSSMSVPSAPLVNPPSLTSLSNPLNYQGGYHKREISFDFSFLKEGPNCNKVPLPAEYFVAPQFRYPAPTPSSGQGVMQANLQHTVLPTGWPYLPSSSSASPFRPPQLTNLPNPPTPPHQRSTTHESPPLDAMYREQAFQILLQYGITTPSTNAFTFERMVDQVAHALSKQMKI